MIPSPLLRRSAVAALAALAITWPEMLELHAALILDVAGQKKEAAKHYERSYKLDPTALRVVHSYGSFLSAGKQR